ncbi:MAG: sulfite exporter TauE/SafE family protein [Pseudomonadota bacterium]
MSWETIVYLGLGAAAGGFINGLSGTGTALFALGFFLLVLDPQTSVAIVALMSVLVGLQGLWIVRGTIFAHPRRLLRFMLPGLVGVPLGVTLLDVINASTLRIAIAGFLIVYGGYFGLRSALPAIAQRTPLIDASVGLLGGILGGAAAVSGALPAMWCSVRAWTKAETRAVLQPYNVAILGTTVGLLALKGAYNQTTLNALLVTLPIGFLAAQVGIFVFGKLTDTQFRRLLILLIFAMGLGILISELT